MRVGIPIGAQDSRLLNCKNAQILTFSGFASKNARHEPGVVIGVLRAQVRLSSIRFTLSAASEHTAPDSRYRPT